MKKTGYILLLLILLLQSGGMMLFFNVQQCYVKYQMSERLKSSKTSFEKLILTVSEYQKSQVNSYEISYKGKMYDVKSATVTDDMVELLVIHDAEDENILVQIKNMVNNTGLPNNGLPNQLHKLISLVYLPPFSEHLLLVPSFSFTIFLQSRLDIHSSYSYIFIPPPELV